MCFGSLELLMIFFNLSYPGIEFAKYGIKVVVRAEILPRDFLQTPGNYCL